MSEDKNAASMLLELKQLFALEVLNLDNLSFDSESNKLLEDLDFSNVKTLTLKNSNITTELIGYILIKSKNLETLDLSYCRNLRGQLESLESFDLSKFKTLILNNATINRKLFMRILAQANSLETLDLSDCKIVGGKLKIPANLKLENLKTLNLSRFKVDINQLGTLLAKTNSLETLDLSYCQKLDGKLELSEALNLNKLKKLKLGGSNITTQSLGHILANAKDLETLDLSDCTNLDGELELPEDLDLSNLKTLNLKASNINAKTLGYILSKAKNLEELNLSNCDNIGDTNALLTRRFDLSKLKLLNLGASNISLASLEFILMRTRVLEILSLSHCKNITGTISAAIDLSHLKQLFLNSSAISLTSLECLLNKTSRLETLNLSACLNLGGELSHNIDLSNLKELVVHYTNITVKSIGLILAKTRHLQTLRLGSGLLTGEASDDLLTDLRLDSLKEFDLGWQLLPDFIFERIKSAAPPTLQIKNMHKKRMEKQEVVSNEQLEVEINTSVFNEKMNRICNLLQNDNIKASSKERIQLMHSLLKEQTVTQGYLWVCYKEYAAVFLRQINANNKPQLLAICQELREIHSEQKKISSQEKNQTLPKELTKRLSQYQNSFWITKHRQENATKLQATLQGKTTYKDILNEIVTTRNEVLHHDALEETGMHRFGKSRYYETLNEMEDLLIKAWISDPNAIHEFADYIEIYTSERNDALKTYIDALKQYDAKTYGNIDASVDKRVFSNISRLPGYLRALAVEAKTRDDALCGYQDLLNNASNASPKV